MTITDAMVEARRGLQCLYLEAPEAVVKDVTARVEAAFAALITDSDNMTITDAMVEAAHRAYYDRCYLPSMYKEAMRAALEAALTTAEKQDHCAGNRSEAERERRQYDKPLG